MKSDRSWMPPSSQRGGGQGVRGKKSEGEDLHCGDDSNPTPGALKTNRRGEMQTPYAGHPTAGKDSC